jgi:hypothetical protein
MICPLFVAPHCTCYLISTAPQISSKGISCIVLLRSAPANGSQSFVCLNMCIPKPTGALRLLLHASYSLSSLRPPPEI